MVQKPQDGAEGKERRIDLSLPQVAGSAVAAVAAAVMASQLGVYGTVAGAGVMSVVATCGGSVFQHFFRRTGEQIREVTVQVKHPAGRQVTVRTKETFPAGRGPRDETTRVLRAVTDPEPGRTRPLHGARPGDEVPGDPVAEGLYPGPPDVEAYSDARTHGTRVRGWKRSALAATGVFVLAMAGITAYEAASGHDLGGDGGTTVGSVVHGERNGTTSAPQPPSGSRRGDDGDHRSRPETGSTTAPGTHHSGDGQSEAPAPSGDGASDEPAPTHSPSAGSTAPATTPSAPAEGGDGNPSAPAASGAGEAPGQQGGVVSGPDAGR